MPSYINASLIKLVSILLCLSLSTAGWCSSSTSDRLIDASNKFERDIKLNKMVVGNKAQYKYLHSILKKLAPDSASNYRVAIVNSPFANAYALPNGLIGINTGLLATIDNEAQLAMIVAHEINHIQLNHSVKIRDDYNSTGLVTYLPLLGGTIGEAIYNVYSREHEKEADIGGFKMIVTAGYDNNESIYAFSQMEEFDRLWVAESQGPTGSHPEIPHRVEYLNSRQAHTEGFTGEEVYRNTFHDIRVSQFRHALNRRQFDWLIQRMNYLSESSNNPVWQQYKVEAYRQRDAEGDIDNATKILEASIEGSPDYLPFYYSQALLFLSLQRLAEAKQAFEQFLRLEDDAYKKEMSYAKFYLSQIDHHLPEVE